MLTSYSFALNNSYNINTTTTTTITKTAVAAAAAATTTTTTESILLLQEDYTKKSCRQPESSGKERTDI
jgi:hypothetical protein